MLRAYPWPGNVRELRNALERALIVGASGVVEPQAFPERIASAVGPGVTLGGPHNRWKRWSANTSCGVMASVPTLDESSPAARH
ncbi:AAA-type ATPase lid domain-containing protein [Corallococcus exiguus]|uniref:hypothetical protein n=1 Tax=Corallococcus exiguus TaxID=83462 RepID=UPI001F5FC8EF|nr:hypothetical protein [Corallococcus exiguus]